MRINYTTGYAGTGKSTKLIELCEKLPLKTTIVVAPTHKALARIQDSLPDGMECRTIHSMLGWIPSINEKAETVNQIDTTIKLSRELYEYTDIVIDEAGMMSEDMLFELTSRIEEAQDYANTKDEQDITIHCFLDPYQLLPVRGVQIQTDPDTTTNLTTQYRAESPDVVALYTKFVHYLQGTNKKDLSTPYSENVKKFDIKEFKRGDRLLAYTNEAVGRWNGVIAQHLGIQGTGPESYIGQEVQLGNMLDTVLVTDIIELNPKNIFEVDKLIAWYLDGTLKLQNNQINRNFLEPSLFQLIINKNINFIQDIRGHIYPVIIGIDYAKKIIQETKEMAIKDRKEFKNVYALNRAFIMDYNFATTVHKAQGSEFDRVFIDKLDIQRSINNGYYSTYARLMYVSLSRAKSAIFI